MDLNSFLENTFKDIAQQVPGFISVTLLKGDDGTPMYIYPPEKKKQLSVMSPFHLQIYNQAVKSLEMQGENDVIKEILITTETKLYVLASRTRLAVGVLTLDADKANLGLARLHSKKVGDAIAAFLKNAI